jgi:signal transduction histidine kinase
VQIEVSDSGKGISEEDLDRIFTPFFTTRHGGTGLGLATSHRIIEDHHGTIEVNSQVGRGSTFTITLRVDPFAEPGVAQSPDP